MKQPYNSVFRVFVSTDLGDDQDDIQSLMHLLHYSDMLKAEGISTTTNPDSIPRKALIEEWAVYEKYTNVSAHADSSISWKHGTIMYEHCSFL